MYSLNYFKEACASQEQHENKLANEPKVTHYNEVASGSVKTLLSILKIRTHVGWKRLHSAFRDTTSYKILCDTVVWRAIIIIISYKNEFHDVNIK